MYFTEVVFKSILRRRFRSALTAIGVAIAITAVVALLGISGGLEESSAEMYESRGVDLVVARAGVAQRQTSTLNEQIRNRLIKLPSVAAVMPSLTDTISLGQGNVVTPVRGWPANSFGVANLEFVSGRAFRPKESDKVILGQALADRLRKKVGDYVEIELHQFQVVGIYRSYNVFENGAAIVPLEDLQTLMDRQGQVSEFQIMLTKGPDMRAISDQVRAKIESLKDSDGRPLGLAAMPTEAYVKSTTELRLARAMAWITSTIALLIGSVGVLNTMIMSVMERTQEIGILRAIGWRRRRIVRLVLGESMMLSLAGAVVGIGAAILLTRALSAAPAAHGFVRGNISLSVVGVGFLLSLLVGVVGGAYPAFRAAALAPTEALRYE